MSTVPTGAKAPQDHKAKAVVSEGKGEAPAATTFEYRGTTYTVDPLLLDDLEVLESIEDGKSATFLRRVLADQYVMMKDQIKADNDGRVPSAAVEEFVTAMFGAVVPTDKR